jgi:hypothetical protein
MHKTAGEAVEFLEKFLPRRRASASGTADRSSPTTSTR